MKNRNLIIRRIEQLEGNFKTLHFLCTRGGKIEDFVSKIKDSEEILSDLKAYIEREPLGPSELNKID
jgi:hypothetical protein